MEPTSTGGVEVHAPLFFVNSLELRPLPAMPFAAAAVLNAGHTLVSWLAVEVALLWWQLARVCATTYLPGSGQPWETNSCPLPAAANPFLMAWQAQLMH